MEASLSALVSAVREAGRTVMTFRRDGFSVATKSHAFDYVTDADHASDRLLTEAIRNRFPDDKILSEESEHRPADYRGRVWMIDPLDGTRQFVEGLDGFVIMVGLAVDGRPEIGIVHDPVRDVTHFAKRDAGAFRQSGESHPERISVSRTDAVEGMTLMERANSTEGRPTDRLIATLGVGKTVQSGSMGERIVRVAEGEADAVFCSGPRAMKWDFCAPQAILEEAGGRMTRFDGSPVDYLVPDGRFDALILATNGVLHDELLSCLRDFRESSS